MPNLVNRRRKKNKVIESSTNAIKSDSTDSDYEFSSKLNYNHNYNNVMLSERSKSSHSNAAETILHQHEANEIRYKLFFY